MRRVQEELKGVNVPFKVAVMGCVVNGPGEGREADIGICGGGNGAGLLIKKGQQPQKVTGDLAQILIDEIRQMLVKLLPSRLRRANLRHFICLFSAAYSGK